jgi:hypothetical protein
MKITGLELPGVTRVRGKVAFFALALLMMAPPMYSQAPLDSSAVTEDDSNRGPDVSAYVSSNLESGEHEYMRNAINQLPARMKEKFLQTDPTHVSISVYDAASGEMHYNRPELSGALHLEPSRPLPGDDYPLAIEGRKDTSPGAISETVTSCGGSPAPGCISGAGPYRRIFTPPVAPEVTCPSGVRRPCTAANGTDNGYWISGSVTTDCKAGIFKQKGDIGFAFMGGYSTSPDETGGSVDAGLKYNYEDDPSHPNLDSYEMFIGIRNEPKLVYASTNPPGDLQPHFIDCGGPPALMEFRVAPWELNVSKKGSGCVAGKGVGSPYNLKACARVAFILERGVGGVGQQYNEEVIVWVSPSVSFGGWGVLATSNQGTPQKPQTDYFPQVPCGGCIFKWVTGIGQEQENLTDGSLYSATWSNRGIAPWATDPGTKVLPPNGNPVPMTANLTLCTEYPLWRGIYDGVTVKEDCSDTPAVTGNAGDVKVANYSVQGELDSITLTEKGVSSTTPVAINPHVE